MSGTTTKPLTPRQLRRRDIALRNTLTAVIHQLEHGEASTGDRRDIAWCARELREAQELIDVVPSEQARKGVAG